jgi:hypothetical protein
VLCVFVRRVIGRIKILLPRRCACRHEGPADRPPVRPLSVVGRRLMRLPMALVWVDSGPKRRIDGLVLQ